MRRNLLLVPIGEIPPHVLKWIEDALPPIFDCTCRVGPGLAHPDYAWDGRRGQFRAETILRQVDAGDSWCALAVVDLDLFVAGLHFVFGMAQRGMTRAIVALPRLRQSFYGMPENATVFRERLVKEAVHELGHVVGLPHCDDSRCVMAFSNSLQDTDYKLHTFCRDCKRRLHAELIEE